MAVTASPGLKVDNAPFFVVALRSVLRSLSHSVPHSEECSVTWSHIPHNIRSRVHSEERSVTRAHISTNICHSPSAWIHVCASMAPQCRFGLSPKEYQTDIHRLFWGGNGKPMPLRRKSRPSRPYPKRTSKRATRSTSRRLRRSRTSRTSRTLRRRRRTHRGTTYRAEAVVAQLTPEEAEELFLRLKKNDRADEVFYQIIAQMRRAGTLNKNHNVAYELLNNLLQQYRYNPVKGLQELAELLQNITEANDAIAEQQVEAAASQVSPGDLPS